MREQEQKYGRVQLSKETQAQVDALHQEIADLQRKSQVPRALHFLHTPWLRLADRVWQLSAFWWGDCAARLQELGEEGSVDESMAVMQQAEALKVQPYSPLHGTFWRNHYQKLGR